MRFRNRRHAGRLLAARLGEDTFKDPVVLALPRGGVPVGYEVAVAMSAPLDVFVARKVGAPGHEEFGIGAIAEGGESVMDDVVLRLGISAAAFAVLANREETELDRRVERYRGGSSLPDLAGRDVILVDDGLATGVTAEAALKAIRRLNPARVVLAVPVCAPDSQVRLGAIADRVVCLAAPQAFRAVGVWYDDFSPTTDSEVLELLAVARLRDLSNQ